MGQTLAQLPLAVAYGIWAGPGMVLVSAFGVACFDECLDRSRICGFACDCAEGLKRCERRLKHG